MASEYGFATTLTLPFETALARVKTALQAEGFGVLTEIDVQRTLQEKIGVEMEAYRILGACNPQLAHRALQVEPSVGLLLPCNVVVRETSAGSRVEIVDPDAMLGVVGNRQLNAIADEARERLRRVLTTLSGQPSRAST